MEILVQSFEQFGLPIAIIVTLIAYIYWQTSYIRTIHKEYKDSVSKISDKFADALHQKSEVDKEHQAKVMASLERMTDDQRLMVADQKKITELLYVAIK